MKKVHENTSSLPLLVLSQCNAMICTTERRSSLLVSLDKAG